MSTQQNHLWTAYNRVCNHLVLKNNPLPPQNASIFQVGLRIFTKVACVASTMFILHYLAELLPIFTINTSKMIRLLVPLNLDSSKSSIIRPTLYRSDRWRRWCHLVPSRSTPHLQHQRQDSLQCGLWLYMPTAPLWEIPRDVLCKKYETKWDSKQGIQVKHCQSDSLTWRSCKLKPIIL